MPGMTLDELRATLNESDAPKALPKLVSALWWEAKGDWEKAHLIAQDVPGRDGAWVHAYLHRKEGDEGNAGYWYQQAGRSHCRLSFGEEWAEIVTELLAR
jgi:hypothetical protein